MTEPTTYTVTRIHLDSYRLDSLKPPRPSAVAFIHRARDRLGNATGWKLKPLVMMQGAKSRLWVSVEEALIATKLMKPGEAKKAVAAANAEMPRDDNEILACGARVEGKS